VRGVAARLKRNGIMAKAAAAWQRNSIALSNGSGVAGMWQQHNNGVMAAAAAAMKYRASM